MLGGPRRRQIAILIGEAHDAVGVAHVDPGGVRPEGIKGDAEGLVQALGEDRDLGRLAIRANAAEDLDLAGLALGQEEVAVGRGADQPRIVQAGGIKLHFEALGAMGHALAGRGTMVGPLSTDSCCAGPGRSATVRWRRMPGASCAASVKAAWPVSTERWRAACACHSAICSTRKAKKDRVQ